MPESVRVFFEQNLGAVNLVYGLTFVVMAVAILVQPTEGGDLRLARVLGFFVAYALIHSVADFIDMWALMSHVKPIVGPYALAITAVSYLFLFEFGRRLVGLTRKVFPWWILPLLVGIVTAGASMSSEFMPVFDVLIGYLVRVPAGLMSGLGLIWYYDTEKERLGTPQAKKYFIAAGWAFLAWTFFCGVVRAKANFFPADWINVSSFFDTVGVPVQVFRMMCGVVAAWGITGALRIFSRQLTANLRQARAEAEADLEARREAERGSSEAREYVETLLDSANAPIVVWNEDRKVTRFNRAFERLSGYSPAEVVGREVGMLFVGKAPGRTAEDAVAALGGERGEVFEASILCKGGGARPALWTIADVQTASGRPRATIAQGMDITERKLAEEELARRDVELNERNMEMAALSDVSFIVEHAEGVDKLLKQSMDVITRLGMFNFQRKGGVLIVEGDDMRLIPCLGPEPSPAFIAAHDGMKVGECLCGIAARTGEAIVSCDSDSDDRHTIRYLDMEPHGHVIIPLTAMTKVVGVMYLYMDTGARVDERKLDLLKAIGMRLGVAVENAQLYEQTRILSLHDSLTGLANRRLMYLELERSLTRTRRHGEPLSVVMLDLDHFKDFNDEYGHVAGDELLVDVAKAATSSTREMDLATRYGGEEFLVVLPNTGTDAAEQVAERIRDQVARVVPRVPKRTRKRPGVTVSAGVATCSEAVSTEDDLISMADKALYEAKKKGRNRVEKWAA